MATRKAPDTDAQLELFSAVFTDINTRDAQDTMAVPFLSLSKSPRFEPLEYKDPERGIEVTVSGGRPWGIANIWDWDLIMWLLSQVRQAVDHEQPTSPRIRFHRHAFLKDARRHVGGKQYVRLEESITRLKNTHVRTSIRAVNGKTEMFSWIERATIERDERGRMAHAVVQLPDWLFRAACDHQLVLTLHPNYFLLTGGIERFLYRLLRKSAGATSWEWKLRTLHVRSGSTQPFSQFARDLRKVIAKDSLLDYELEEFRKEGTDEPYLRARRIVADRKPDSSVVSSDQEVAFLPSTTDLLRLDLETYERGRQLAPGYDIYKLEREWIESTIRNGIEVRSPDKMFLKWCAAIGRRSPLRAR